MLTCFKRVREQGGGKWCLHGKPYDLWCLGRRKKVSLSFFCGFPSAWPRLGIDERETILGLVQPFFFTFLFIYLQLSFDHVRFLFSLRWEPSPPVAGTNLYYYVTKMLKMPYQRVELRKTRHSAFRFRSPGEEKFSRRKNAWITTSLAMPKSDKSVTRGKGGKIPRL